MAFRASSRKLTSCVGVYSFSAAVKHKQNVRPTPLFQDPKSKNPKDRSTVLRCTMIRNWRACVARDMILRSNRMSSPGHRVNGWATKVLYYVCAWQREPDYEENLPLLKTVKEETKTNTTAVESYLVPRVKGTGLSQAFLPGPLLNEACSYISFFGAGRPRSTRTPNGRGRNSPHPRDSSTPPHGIHAFARLFLHAFLRRGVWCGRGERHGISTTGCN